MTNTADIRGLEIKIQALMKSCAEEGAEIIAGVVRDDYFPNWDAHESEFKNPPEGVTRGVFTSHLYTSIKPDYSSSTATINGWHIDICGDGVNKKINKKTGQAYNYDYAEAYEEGLGKPKIAMMANAEPKALKMAMAHVKSRVASMFPKTVVTP